MKFSLYFPVILYVVFSYVNTVHSSGEAVQVEIDGDVDGITYTAIRKTKGRLHVTGVEAKDTQALTDLKRIHAKLQSIPARTRIFTCVYKKGKVVTPRVKGEARSGFWNTRFLSGVGTSVKNPFIGKAYVKVSYTDF